MEMKHIGQLPFASPGVLPCPQNRPAQFSQSSSCPTMCSASRAVQTRPCRTSAMGMHALQAKTKRVKNETFERKTGGFLITEDFDK